MAGYGHARRQPVVVAARPGPPQDPHRGGEEQRRGGDRATATTSACTASTAAPCLPDGRVVPVAADARFVRKTSRSLKTFTTAVAFPAVQVGAILEYEYELWFDSIFFLEPWYFAEEIPVRYSEITFKTPLTVAAQAWSRGPARVKIQRQTDQHLERLHHQGLGGERPLRPRRPLRPPLPGPGGADAAAADLVHQRVRPRSPDGELAEDLRADRPRLRPGDPQGRRRRQAGARAWPPGLSRASAPRRSTASSATRSRTTATSA